MPASLVLIWFRGSSDTKSLLYESCLFSCARRVGGLGLFLAGGHLRYKRQRHISHSQQLAEAKSQGQARGRSRAAVPPEQQAEAGCGDSSKQGHRHACPVTLTGTARWQLNPFTRDQRWTKYRAG